MSDLISREAVLAQMKNYHDDCAQTSEYTRLGFETAMEVVKTEPSADIMDCARKIKEYCEGFPDCEGCRFDNGTFRCEFHACPCDWDLPEGEKE